MATKIVTKNSSTAGAAPTATDLVQGELAVNVADGRLYTEDNAAAIVELGVNPATEITANAGIALPDSQKATFGAGDDLQIYHDGGNSYIDDVGTGDLVIRGSSAVYLQKYAGENMLKATADAGVQVFYNNAEKLATTSTGIDVTGTATMDGLTVDAVALNTTLKTWDANTDAVQFQSGSLWNYSTSQLNLGQNEYYNGAYKYLTTGFATTYNQASGGHYFKTASSGSADATITWRNTLHMANNGDVSFYEDTGTTAKLFWDASAESLGIGTSSPVSDALLTLAGAQGATQSLYFNGFGTDLDAAISHSNANIIFANGGNNTGVSALAERMRIDSSGRVGIGGTPTAPLHVFGAGILGASSTNPIAFTGSGGSNAGIGSYNANTDFNMYAAGTGAIKFRNAATWNSSGELTSVGTERMRIDSSGNLLVGQSATTVPGVGNTTAGSAIGSAGYIFVSKSGDTPAHFNRNTNDGDIITLRKNGTTVGSISVTASATTYNTSSDQRLKENIADADDAGSKIDAIQVRKYDWKADGSHQDYGMIAQELQAVAPEAVSGDADSEEMMGVDYSKLVPMLIKEIQSLRNRVAQLETGE